VLIDGFVGARWKTHRQHSTATFTIHPFARLARRDRESLIDEGRRFLAFAVSDVPTHDVRFLDVH